MMKWIKLAIAWCWNHLTKISMFLSWAISFALPAWAASTVEILSAYSPLSWVIAGLAGWAIAGLGYAGVGIGAYWRTMAKIRSVWARSPNPVDPMETVFRNKRINVADLITPYHRVISNKNFIDCELVGPANLFIAVTSGSGSLAFHGNTFQPSETVMIKNDASPPNAIVLQDCSFSRCTFYGVILFFREAVFEAANRLISNLYWVTATPQAMPPHSEAENQPNPSTSP
ncbi:MAG TPA: hypothetical protein PKY87_05075 [Terricaulis sp.]|nr:hypothetical protein [Terricaulis sp.]